MSIPTGAACLMIAVACVGMDGIAAGHTDAPRHENTVKLVHDFGVVEVGAKYSHTFHVISPFDQVFLVGGITRECGCTNVDLSTKEWQPGHELAVTVEVEILARHGDTWEKSVVISCKNDPKRIVQIVLSATFSSDPRLYSEPARIVLGDLPMGSTRFALFQVRRGDRSEIAIVSVEASTPAITVKPFIDRSQEANVGVFRLEVDSKRMHIGAFHEWVRITTGHATEKQIAVQVEGSIGSSVRAKPAKLFLGKVSGEGIWQFSLYSLAQEQVQIQEVYQTLGDAWSVRFEGNRVELRHMNGKDVPEGLVVGKVTANIAVTPPGGQMRIETICVSAAGMFARPG